MWRRLRMLENKDYAPQCAEMIEKQLRRRGISDEAVLAAMTAVPRHEFVPEALRSRAYEDVPLPIGGGSNILQAFFFSPMTAALPFQPGDPVVENWPCRGYSGAVVVPLAEAGFSLRRRAGPCSA